MSTNVRVGVFVDAENVRYNGGYQMRYDVLRRFAAREGGTLQRLNTYMAFDAERAREDIEYRKKAQTYQQMVRDFGWKITVKLVRRYTDEAGNVTTKANADLDMAVDAMLQANKLDQVLLVTGDGDFLQVVEALQNTGCRVELIGFKNVSRLLQQEVDAYYSGFVNCCRLTTNHAMNGENPVPVCAACVPNGSPIRATAFCASWIIFHRTYGLLIRVTRIRLTPACFVISTNWLKMSTKICYPIGKPYWNFISMKVIKKTMVWLPAMCG